MEPRIFLGACQNATPVTASRVFYFAEADLDSRTWAVKLKELLETF